MTNMREKEGPQSITSDATVRFQADQLINLIIMSLCSTSGSYQESCWYFLWHPGILKEIEPVNGVKCKIPKERLVFLFSFSFFLSFSFLNQDHWIHLLERFYFNVGHSHRWSWLWREKLFASLGFNYRDELLWMKRGSHKIMEIEFQFNKQLQMSLLET